MTKKGKKKKEETVSFVPGETASYRVIKVAMTTAPISTPRLAPTWTPASSGSAVVGVSVGSESSPPSSPPSEEEVVVVEGSGLSVGSSVGAGVEPSPVVEGVGRGTLVKVGMVGSAGSSVLSVGAGTPGSSVGTELGSSGMDMVPSTVLGFGGGGTSVVGSGGGGASVVVGAGSSVVGAGSSLVGAGSPLSTSLQKLS